MDRNWTSPEMTTDVLGDFSPLSGTCFGCISGGDIRWSFVVFLFDVGVQPQKISTASLRFLLLIEKIQGSGRDF